VRYTRIVIATVATLSFAGCAAVGPDHKAPEMKVATNFDHARERGIKPGGVVDLQWWRLFSDATLTELVHQAVAANHDLKIATARMRQARALRGAPINTLPSMERAHINVRSSVKIHRCRHRS